MASHGTHANPKGVSWNIQNLTDGEVVWAGPSNAGLVDPAQCSLIALADITDGLVTYAVSEPPDSADHGIFFALVRQQEIHLLTDHTIRALAEVHDQQEAEEEAKADLISRAKTVLREDAPMTAENLSTEIEVDPEALADALGAAVTRGELLQETHYRNQPEDSDDARP